MKGWAQGDICERRQWGHLWQTVGGIWGKAYERKRSFKRYQQGVYLTRSKLRWETVAAYLGIALEEELLGGEAQFGQGGLPMV